ncbi:hypothetical protein [Caulobacter sp. 17J65-9]|uniref:hypothetical protein n=1 Tax=Caulobacter sp. 17J65-9 TaxID=2709382 RepID=UPI0013CC6040|nr:hypothetical protein [Caulobacter sp. 17J65-9]NEX92968.1 hypothetical protein [Caulobacter sp. 17J65-9]
MVAIAYPFLRIIPEEVIAEPWTRATANGPVLVDRQVPRWDHAVDLVLRRRLQINLASVAQRFGVAEKDLHLEFIVTVATGGPRGDRHRSIHWRGAVSMEETARVAAVSLAGMTLSQRMNLRTELLMRDPVPAGSSLMPGRAGLRLWEDVHRVQLEPEEARFPTEAVRFSERFPNSGEALWRIDWSPAHLEREFAGAVRLYVNLDFPDFVQRVSDAEDVTMRLITGGIVSQLSRGALDSLSFELGIAESVPGSLGAAIASWLRLAFPNQSLDVIRSRMVSDPAGFEAELSVLLQTEGPADD